MTTLRAFLRARTAPQHDLLDNSVSFECLSEPLAYARFLGGQLRARLGIERWAQANCPDALRPPPTTPLLIDDLQALGRPFSIASAPFRLPPGADPLGLAWAVAGSQMGNRAMLARLRRSGAALPMRFLSDRRTDAFWKAILPQLEREVPADRAEAAALAADSVFAHFHRAFEVDGRRSAA